MLVVEDKKTGRIVLAEQLKKAGIMPKLVTSGEEAGRGARCIGTGREFAVAILDMKLPDMNGIELARRLKDNPALAPMRLVMLTSIQGTGEVAAARSAGIDAYLSKPVSEKELIRVLGETLAGKPRRPARASSKVSGKRFAHGYCWPRTTSLTKK